MSLRVWLPLIGDFHNQGLDGNISITNYGSVFDTAGKIADSCCSFDGTNDYFQFSNLDLNGLEELSISFWVYSATETLNGLFLVRNSSTQHQIRISGDGFTFRDKAHSTQQNMSFEQPTINTWTHYVVIYDNGSTRAYKNGIQIAEKIYSNTSSLNTSLADIRVGRIQSSTGNTYFSGKLNDFRIYDHALSDKEIKEISKGLILNYKLDGNGLNNENLFKNSSLSNLTTTNLSSKLRYVSTYPPEITSDGIKFTWSGSSAREIGLWLNKSLKVDTDYTLSFVYKSNMQVGSSFYLRNGNILVGYWSQTTIPQATDWTYYTCTFKPVSYQSGDITTGNSLTLFYSGYTANKWIELKQDSIKLEEGTKATTWCPSTNDIEYLNQQNNIIFDGSGYCNNGTLVGSLTTIYSSARHNNSSYFENYTTYIQRNMGALVPDAITMSCWIKGTNRSPKGGYHIPLNMHSTNFEISIAGGTPAKARMGFVVGGTRYVSNIGSDILDGQWHMLTSTFNGTTICRYVDGVLVNSETRTGVLTSLSTLGIGNFPGGTTYGNTQLYESDVRIYVTALSAEDILELYRAGESIDKAGNLYAYEFYEDDNTSILTGKNGVVTAKEYDNQDNLTSFYKTGQIYTNELKEI